MERQIKNRSCYIMDIETYKFFYCICMKNIDTKEKVRFYIHESKSELIKMCEFIDTVKGFIGFNVLGFDSQVIQYIQDNYNKWRELSNQEVIDRIYLYAQKTIDISNKGGFAQFPEYKLRIPYLDLFKIWHFDNKAKMTSLKWIEYGLDLPNIKEMPYHHTNPVSIEQIEDIMDYCENDIDATEKFYEVTIGNTDNLLYKGKDKVQLRKDIRAELGLNCRNYNDVRIGDEINKLSYCNLTGRDKKSLKKPGKKDEKFTFGDCFPSYTKFKTTEFNNFINAFKNIEINLKKEAKEHNKQKFPFTFNGTTYVVAKGGIHSEDRPRIVKPSEDEILRDADIGSQYPNALVKRILYPRHLGKEWLIGYKGNIEKRLLAKAEFKKTKDPKFKSIDEVYKLALNGGGFGKLGEEHSWQYDPFIMYSCTIGNQIEILMLIEALEINGIHVISANTDGIVCLFKKNQNELYYKICKEWEIIVGNDKMGQLEYQDYELLVQMSVNSYLAVKPGEEPIEKRVKTKDEFVSDCELHKNKSKRVVPLALQEYFTKGIPVEQFIKNHNNIFDFCLGVKSIGSNRLIHLDTKANEEIILQKINRYYISTNGHNLLKRLPALENKKVGRQLDIFGNEDDGTREQEVEAGWLSTIYNNHIEKDMKDYDIDYNFYIQSTKRIINQIENNE